MSFASEFKKNNRIKAQDSYEELKNQIKRNKKEDPYEDLKREYMKKVEKAQEDEYNRQRLEADRARKAGGNTSSARVLDRDYKKPSSAVEALNRRIADEMGVKDSRSEKLVRAESLERIRGRERDRQLFSDQSSLEREARKQALEELKARAAQEDITGTSGTLKDLSRSISKSRGENISESDVYQMIENEIGQIDNAAYEEDRQKKKSTFENIRINEKDYKELSARGREKAETKSTYKNMDGVDMVGTGRPDILSASQNRIYQNMTEEEKNMFGYYLETQGQKKAKEYMETIERDVNKRVMDEEKARLSQMAEEHPVLSSVASVPAGWVKGAGYLETVRQSAENAIKGQDVPVDVNAPAFWGSQAQSAIRETVQKDMGELGKFLYQTGMSMGDFLSLLPAGPAALPLMSTGAATDTAKEVISRGGSNAQATQMGLVAGAAELVTEKIGIDRLSKLVKAGRGAKAQFIKQVITEGAIPEGLEEVVTELVNNAADDKLMQDLSDKSVKIKAYMEQGLTRQQAEQMVLKERIKETALAFAGGALSGAVMGGGAYAAGYLEANDLGGRIAKNEGMEEELRATALQMEGTQAQEMARELEEKELSNYERGMLYEQVQQDMPEVLKRAFESEETPGTQTLARQTEVKTEQPTNSPSTEENTLKTANTRSRFSASVSYEGVAAEVTGIDRVENGKIHVKISTGDNVITQPIDRISFEDADTERLYRTAENYGNAGARNFILEYNGENFENYKKGFDAYYNAGLVEFPKVNVHSEYGNLLTQSQQATAYQAGITDMETNLAIKYDAMKQNISKATQKGSLIDNTKKLRGTQRSILESYAKISGTNIIVDETINNGKANGYYDGQGNIHIAYDSDNPFSVVTNHELTHHIQQYSALYDEYKQFVARYLMEQNGTTVDELIDKEIGKYVSVDRVISRDEALDEIVANAAEMFLTDEVAINELAQENPSLASKILGFIRDLIKDIKAALKGYNPKSKEAQMLNENLEVAQEAERLWVAALQDAKKNAERGANTNQITETRNMFKYSLNKDAEKVVHKVIGDISYRDDVLLRDHSPEIMIGQKGVKDLPMVMKASHIRENVLTEEEAKNLGLKVNEHTHYHGIGDVFFLKVIDGLDDVDLAYRGTKKAKDSSRRENYFLLISKLKDASGNTVNVPVYINEHAQYNRVFVDVNKISTVFGRDNFDDYIKRQIKNGDLVRIKKRSVKSSERDALIAPGYRNNASTLNISQNEKNATEKGSFSLKDSQGRDLSKEQQGYFKESKVRNEKGELLVMYHGSPAQFTVFDKKKAKSSGYYGRGFYFTDSDTHAGQYGERYEVYLNIKSPVKAGTRNITKEQLKKFVSEIAENEDYGIDNYGYGATVDSVTDSVYGKDDFAMLMDLNATCVGDMVETIELFNEINGTDYDGIITPTETVAFYPEQIKNTTNQKPSGDSDIRFSLKDTAAVDYESLREENSQLREINQNLQDMIRLQEGSEPNQDEIEKVSRFILKKYQSAYDIETLKSNLTNLWKYIANSRDVNADEVARATMGIAKEILNQSRQVDRSITEQYKDLIKEIRTTKITLNESYYRDMDQVGGYAAFRKAHFGTIRLGKDGIDIDSYYQSLTERYPELFRPEDAANPADQLIKIADTLEMLRPSVINPYGMNMDQAAADLAYEIYDSYFNISKMGNAYETKKIAELNKARSQYKERQKKLRQEFKEAYEERLNELRQENARLRRGESDKLLQQKAKYDESARRRATRREESEDRTRLLKALKRISKMNSTPENMKRAQELIGDIDLVAKSMTAMGQYNLEVLRDRYNEMLKTDPDFVRSDAIEEKIKRLDKERINDMGIQGVRELLEAVLEFEHKVQTDKKLIDSEYKKTNYELAREIEKEVKESKGYNPKSVISDALNKYNTMILSSIRELRKMSGYKDGSKLVMLGKELNDGQLKATKFKQDSTEYFDPFVKGNKEFMDKVSDEFNIYIGEKDGKKYYISKAMRISLYLHSKNEANLRHIIGGTKVERGEVIKYSGGGITVPDIDLFKTGKVAEAYARGENVKLTKTGLQSILSGMTAKETELANLVHNYLNGMASGAINETSLKLDGYERARVTNYFPIRTDANFTTTEFEAIMRDASIEGMGILKARSGGVNPVMLEDVLQVVNRQMDSVSKYYGLAIPVRNFNKIFNSTATAYEGSVKKQIAEKWGTRGIRYIENLIADVQGARKSESSWIDKIRGKYAQAVLTLNPSVTMKQAASFPTAAATIGWKPVIKALNATVKVDRALIDKYTPLLWYRNQGNMTNDVVDAAKAKTWEKKLPDVVQWNMNWIQNTDTATVKRLWLATEYYVQDNFKNLKKDTDAYYKKVAEIYNQVIEDTQPNYTVMQRPDILRSTNQLTKALTMFSTQRLQNYNIVYDAVGEFRAKKAEFNKGTITKERMDEASKKLANAISSQVVSAAVISVMTFAAAVALHRKKNYEDEDGTITWSSVMRQMANDFASTIAGSSVGGSELYSLLYAALSDGTWYGVEAGNVQTLNDVLDAVKGVLETSAQLATGEATWQECTESFADLGMEMSKVFGIPLANIQKIYNSGILWFQDIKTGSFLAADDKYYALDLQMLKAQKEGDKKKISELEDKMSDRSKSKITAGLNRAAVRELNSMEELKDLKEKRKAGDLNGYKKALNKLVSMGYTEKQIISAANSDGKDRLPEYTYDELYEVLRNGDQTTYESMFNTMVLSGKKEDTIKTEMNKRRNAQIKEENPKFQKAAEAKAAGDQMEYERLRNELTKEYADEGYDKSRIANIIKGMVE